MSNILLIKCMDLTTSSSHAGGRLFDSQNLEADGGESGSQEDKNQSGDEGLHESQVIDNQMHFQYANCGVDDPATMSQILETSHEDYSDGSNIPKLSQIGEDVADQESGGEGESREYGDQLVNLEKSTKVTKQPNEKIYAGDGEDMQNLFESTSEDLNAKANWNQSEIAGEEGEEIGGYENGDQESGSAGKSRKDEGQEANLDQSEMVDGEGKSREDEGQEANLDQSEMVDDEYEEIGGYENGDQESGDTGGKPTGVDILDRIFKKKQDDNKQFVFQAFKDTPKTKEKSVDDAPTNNTDNQKSTEDIKKPPVKVVQPPVTKEKSADDVPTNNTDNQESTEDIKPPVTEDKPPVTKEKSADDVPTNNTDNQESTRDIKPPVDIKKPPVTEDKPPVSGLAKAVIVVVLGGGAIATYSQTSPKLDPLKSKKSPTNFNLQSIDKSEQDVK